MRNYVLLGVLAAAAALPAVGCAADRSEEPSASVGSSLSDNKGRKLFFEEMPGVQGNGRACATCHVEEDGFQLSPAHVQARWAALQEARQQNPNADDPLFRAIDDDADHAGNYTMLRNWALVRVTIKLPVDAAGNKLVWPADDPNATEVSLLRSTQTTFNVGMTAPYQWDGREATLQDQALGAVHGHGESHHDPNPLFLDGVADFQKNLFSGDNARAIANAIANGETPPAPETGPLNATEQQGKKLFGVFCATCHGGPSQDKPISWALTFQNILTSRPLPPPAAGITSFVTPPPLPLRFWVFRLPNGTTTTIPSTDPGKALISGNPADINQFETPSLLGVNKTAPYFHDNSAKDLNDVLVQYVGLYQFLIRLPAPPGSFNENVRALAASELNGAPALITPPMVEPIIAYMNKL